jgi:predicted carbohydrate-binding protein with CBM5 and CBM33 domain
VKLLTVLGRVDPKTLGVDELLAVAAVLEAGLVVLVAAVVAALGLVGVPAAAASTCSGGAVNRGTAGDYSICQGGAWQHYPAPTYDPSSADGYGPNQPLPPACIRFNQPCPQ